MSSLFSSLREKAQSAVNSSGLTSHNFGRSDGAESPPPGQSSGGVAGIMKSHAFESLHHQLRTFQQQYSYVLNGINSLVWSLILLRLQELDNACAEDHNNYQGCRDGL